MAFSESGVISTKSASFGGTLLETHSPIATLRLRVTIPSAGNAQNLYYKDAADPTSRTNGTLKLRKPSHGADKPLAVM